jgi:hypothetical protein
LDQFINEFNGIVCGFPRIAFTEAISGAIIKGAKTGDFPAPAKGKGGVQLQFLARQI